MTDGADRQCLFHKNNCILRDVLAQFLLCYLLLIKPSWFVRLSLNMHAADQDEITLHNKCKRKHDPCNDLKEEENTISGVIVFMSVFHDRFYVI